MLEAVRQIIQKYGLIAAGDTVVVGVSGGADSLALLHLLNQLGPRMGFSIHAATLDHQLRGEESKGDARFVEEICQQWGIGVTVGQADVSEIVRNRQLSLEAAARLARYDFLASVAQKAGAQRIATAHHANDQAETVLLHLLRGTGTHGLRGMSWQSVMPGHPHLILIRPLLQTTRAEIEAYCRENGLTPRQDSSNQDATILRNHLRLDILPQLEQLNPRIQQVLTQLAEVAAVEDDYLQRQMEEIKAGASVNEPGKRVTIGRDEFRELHPALQRRFLIWAAECLGKSESVDYRHVLEAVNLGLKGRQGARSLFGGGLQLRVDYKTLVIEIADVAQTESDQPLLSLNAELSISIPGIVQLDGWALRVGLSPSPDTSIECRLAVPEAAYVSLRTRREGERFVPYGMEGHTQKLNRWMINHKIQTSERGRIPLVCINDEVAALMVKGKWTISEYFAVRNDATRVIYLHYVHELL